MSTPEPVTLPDQAPPAEPAPPAAPGSVPGHVETVPHPLGEPSPGADAHPINPRTGEPTRPWAIWAAAGCFLLAGGVTGVAIAWVYWDAIDRFAEASWLMGQWPTEPGSGWRVLMAIAVTLVAIAVAGVASVVGYHAWAGYHWTRIGGLVAGATASLSLLLNQLAWGTIPLSVLGAGLLWLPAAGRFFAAWHARRHPAPSFAPPTEAVIYGPVPRLR